MQAIFHSDFAQDYLGAEVWSMVSLGEHCAESSHFQFQNNLMAPDWPRIFSLPTPQGNTQGKSLLVRLTFTPNIVLIEFRVL